MTPPPKKKPPKTKKKNSLKQRKYSILTYIIKQIKKYFF